jgi:6-phosphogluconolactonase
LAGQHKVKVFDNNSKLSQAAAQMVTVLSQEATAAHGRFLIALSGGGTPAGLFHLLAQPPYADQIPWTQTHIFWGDERLVPPDDPDSNFGQAADILFKYISIPAANVHRAQGELAAELAVADYITQLQQVAEPGRAWPRFDLAIMGLGSDGHTASLFPGPISEAEQTKPVIAVTADYDGRPAQRISLTPLVFNDARHILFLVAGENKAEAVTAVRDGPRHLQQWPAQRIQPKDGQLIWLLDEAAASTN